MNPNKRQQVTVIYCCMTAQMLQYSIIEIKFQQDTILQQPSTSTNFEII